ncbi:hypothetical protein AVEN_216431-1 [Araneus ventricosus]|uniref:Uncharacterized protein n=1 Tax=Araneus ventricosus TaxID=182803 RepID=A0A4Y2BMY8_ARAVE|nr:hypothetical protein AVEN_216431-1 [Araneus ventricosus]
MEKSQNLFHEHWAIKFGGSFTGPTVPMGNLVLRDRVDHKCGHREFFSVGAVWSTVLPPQPSFKTGPPCSNFPRMTSPHTLPTSFCGFSFGPRVSFPLTDYRISVLWHIG